MVAKRVRDSLPLKLCTLWKDTAGSDEHSSMTGCMDSEEAASISMEYKFCDSANIDEKEQLLELPEIHLPLKHSLLKAFKLMDKELQLHPKIDCFCSGTTAVVLLKQDQDLVIGNLGDSRAVLGTRDKENSLIAVQLTVDLKPNLPREAARIQQCKGRVFALQDEPEVPRVWLPNNDSPGLAMARAFGDFCLKDFGLISVPDISYHRLTERDEFIVIATDGVWDVLSNKEVVDIVASAPSRATAARALVECAVRAWRIRFPTSKSDDCAAVCLFVNHSPSTNNAEKADAEAEPSVPVVVLGKEKTTSLDMVGSSQECLLQRVEEITPVAESIEEKHPSKCQSSRSLAECISTPEEEEWSALEGITRVNSLLNLPRFLYGADKRASSWRKWL
ncbi:hypothetical protein Scep_027195 [Stephania cephalantha]|uniref:PPM-type phosphatase domain-containing protein n=1 Tax=Stephania cephalantha TaxID=152367 RepID=A0AAP0EAP7_9MAGN